MRSDHFAVAAGLIADVLGCRPQDVLEETPVGSLPQWDSIAHLSIIMALEERLGRRLAAEEAASLENVASFVAVLASQGKDGAAI